MCEELFRGFLLLTLTLDGKFVVFPLDLDGYDILIQERNCAVPVQKLMVVLVDDLFDGRVQVKPCVTYKAHVVAQHVVPVAVGAVPPVGHQNGVAVVNIHHHQLRERVTHRVDIEHIAVKVSEID